MSFSSQIKEEQTKHELPEVEGMTLLSAFLGTNVKIEKDRFEIQMENVAVARYIFSLVKKIYGISLELDDQTNLVNKKKIVKLSYEDKGYKILKSLSIIDENNKLINVPHDYLIDNDEEKRSYLSGLFLACGSLNDPKTARYHLEFLVGSKERALYINNLLNEYELNSKYLKRSKGYVVYIKEAEKIGDFLRMINATNALLYFEDIRIYRDQKNMINRLNNCDQANVDKTIRTSNKQIEDIKIIEEAMGLDILGDKTKELALYRLKYPESSMQELSEIISLETEHNISKSGINHRFRKIDELANKIRNG